jgi:hypothetical protein
MEQLTFTSFADYLAAQYAEVRPATLNEKTFLEQFAFHQFQILQSRPLAEQALAALLKDPENPELLKRHLSIQRCLRSLERAAKQALTQLQQFMEHRLALAQSSAQTSTQASVQAKAATESQSPLHTEQEEEHEDDVLTAEDLDELAALDPLLLAPPPPLETLTRSSQRQLER